MEKLILKAARNAIKEEFTGKSLIDRKVLADKNPELSEYGAAFVTLTKDNKLRGCIGSIESYRPLIDDIIGNAKSAAFNDPRFEPVRFEELEDISIEVSILSTPQPVNYESIEQLKKLIKPLIDGVILSKGIHRAVFLPQVWEQLNDFDTFFKHLCNKAGLQNDCLKMHPHIEIFRVTIIEE